jgi:hypothetical protein
MQNNGLSFGFELLQYFLSIELAIPAIASSVSIKTRIDFFCRVTTETFINDLIHFKSSSEKLFFSTILNDLVCAELMKFITSSRKDKGL